MDDARLTVSENVLDRIARAVGPAGMITDPGDMAPYVVDQRKMYHGKTPAVVRPATTAEVSAVLAICSETGTAVVPQGGNTGLCGAATPREDGSEILVSLTRMNKVREIDALNYTLTAEAGVILLDVQKAAAEADRLFPLSLGAEGTARIGGNLSTNAGGTGVLRYGNTRELVLGLEVVLPDGRVWDGLSALRKDNTGYDLKQVFIGAEGTLGIITACVLKLFPLPRQVETAFCAVRDCQAAIEILARARAATDDRVSAFEWIARLGLDLVLDHIPGTRDPLAAPYPEYLLIELASGHEDAGLREVLENILADAMERGEVLDATLAESRGQAGDFWKLRETVPEAQTIEGASLKNDISVPVTSVPQFLSRAGKALEDAMPGIRICSFGHVGDGNVHYNLGQPNAMDADAFYARGAELTGIVNEIATGLRGSISAEHGIGLLKRSALRRYKSPIGMDLMQSIKQAFDPKGIMNPGKVL